jgi:cell division protease FtsH
VVFQELPSGWSSHGVVHCVQAVRHPRCRRRSGAVGYSDFLDQVRNNQIKSAVIQEGQGGTEIVAVTNDDRKVRTTATYLDRGLVGDLIANNVKFDVKPREEGSLLMTLLVSWGPMLLLIGVWIYFMRQMQGGGKGGAFSFGKSKARMLDENNNTGHLRRRRGLRRSQGRSPRKSSTS